MAEIVSVEVPGGVPELAGGVAFVDPVLQETSVSASTIARAPMAARIARGDFVGRVAYACWWDGTSNRTGLNAGGAGCTGCGCDSVWMLPNLALMCLPRFDCWRLGSMRCMAANMRSNANAIIDGTGDRNFDGECWVSSVVGGTWSTKAADRGDRSCKSEFPGLRALGKVAGSGSGCDRDSSGLCVFAGGPCGGGNLTLAA